MSKAISGCPGVSQDRPETTRSEPQGPASAGDLEPPIPKFPEDFGSPFTPSHNDGFVHACFGRVRSCLGLLAKLQPPGPVLALLSVQGHLGPGRSRGVSGPPNTLSTEPSGPVLSGPECSRPPGICMILTRIRAAVSVQSRLGRDRRTVLYAPNTSSVHQF